MLEKLTSRAARWWQNFLPRKRGLGLTAVAVSTAVIAQGSVVTNASWNDIEWTHGTVGSLDCQDPQHLIASRAEGRMLSGSLLNIDLDNLVEAKGVETTNNGLRSLREPDSALDLGDDAYANPLNVEALNLLDINLTGFLELPLNAESGVLNQYAQTTSDGQMVGAGGAVANDGGIALEKFDGNVPDIATLKLSDVLNSFDLVDLGLGTLLQDVADLELNVGAVVGRAQFDGCGHLWGDEVALQREYLTSHLDLEVTSGLIGDLGTTLSSTVEAVENTANGLIGNDSLLAGVLGDVVDVVAGALNLVTGLVGLRVGSDDGVATIETLELDTSPVRELLDEPIGDDVVQISLSDGTVTIDTVALLTAAYPSEYDDGLNGLLPNSNPLQDEHVLSVLTQRLGSTLETLLTDIQTALTNTILLAETTVQLSVPLQRCTSGLLCGLGIGEWVDMGSLGIAISGSIDELLDGNAEIKVDTSILESLLGVIGHLVGGLVDSIVGGLATTVVPAIGGLLEDVLLSVGTLPPTLLEDMGTPVVKLIGGLYENLLLEGILAVTVNPQNDVPGEPHDWGEMAEGRYDVAALRIGVLDVLGDDAVWVYLGRGSVGRVCSPAEAAQLCSDY